MSMTNPVLPSPASSFALSIIHWSSAFARLPPLMAKFHVVFLSWRINWPFFLLWWASYPSGMETTNLSIAISCSAASFSAVPRHFLLVNLALFLRLSGALVVFAVDMHETWIWYNGSLDSDSYGGGVKLCLTRLLAELELGRMVGTAFAPCRLNDRELKAQ